MATDHYIPQSLLRRFADHDKGGNLNVLDKISGRVFHPRVEDFGIEDFHTFSSDLRQELESSELPTLESLIGEKFESPAAPLLASVIASSTLEGLAPAERQVIIEFIALQYVRVPGRMFDLRSALARGFGDQEPARTLRVFGTPTKPDQLRDVGLLGIPIDAVGLANVLRRAHLGLALAPGDLAVVGDNPVIVHSYLELSENFYPAFLVSALGSDAFLPISPRHILYLHTASDAITGTCGRALPGPLHLSADAMNYLNGPQGKAAVRYVVMPRQDQEVQLKVDISTRTVDNFDFKRAFG
ncbi:DUF4238 domain-containing protein [Rhizobium leguminosarum]|uniref:DUF4238 domain-containing protein n=1 Tax=Rhizobium leguminosarum TaxID=384 RepID=UPI001030B215|nr:DUF4238 domain-containing protein [Rhizobium leguminosarum]TAU88183.1 DUF4238 domain-containing protein [Rhizobium leguminosarum]TAV52714.1 DUF4238 domain-containing protein [Rhizobium leguminosarum]